MDDGRLRTMTHRTIRLYDPANNPSVCSNRHCTLWLAATDGVNGEPVSGEDQTANGAVVECLIKAGVLQPSR